MNLIKKLLDNSYIYKK